MKDTANNSAEAHLRQMLIDAHEELLLRDRQLMHAIDRVLPLVDLSVTQVLRRIICKCIPAGSRLLVVSKGDEALLDLGVSASHFPQNESGVYTWHHPLDSAVAINLLEHIRARQPGTDYLLIPAVSFWWLDFYAEFHRHLVSRYEMIWRDSDCAIFHLKDSERTPAYSRTSKPTFGPSGSSDYLRTSVVKTSHNLLPFGVNLAGNFNSEKGTGEAVRSNLRSLAAAGVPFVLNYVADESSSNRVESAGHPFQHSNPYSVNLIHLNPDGVADFINDRGEQYLRDRYNIGYWVWELSDFPEKWAKVFRFFDEIWVPSDFVLDAISRASPIPVVKIPHSVRESGHPIAVDRSRFGITPGAFCFFFMFDFHSFLERKNPYGLIDAFTQAFGSRQDVQLLLKCSRSTPADLQQLQTHVRGANVKVFDRLIDRSELDSMMSACDCYVSLHRSEGFGLTLAEAMNLGKPVIATGYSGNMEFMTIANSFPVKYQTVTLSTDHGAYPAGSHWAEPDVNHAAELMDAVFTDSGLRAKVSQVGLSDIRQKLSPAAIGRLIAQRLKLIEETSRTTAMAAIARSVIPPHVRIAVVTGGDARLLQLSRGQNTIHFPHRQNGAVADLQPLNAAQLIAHLEVSQLTGTRYLLLPGSGFDLQTDHPVFYKYLRDVHTFIHDDSTCKIVELIENSQAVAWRTVPIETKPHTAYGMRFINNQWKSDGADCHIVIKLKSPMFVSALRLIYCAEEAEPVGSHAAFTRVFWCCDSVSDFSEERCASLKQLQNEQTQTRLIVVNETIDHIRIDPDLQPAIWSRLDLQAIIPATDTHK